MAKKKAKLTDEDRKKAVIKSSPLAKEAGITPDEVILGPKRSELIEDGALVDVTSLWPDEETPMVKQAGFKIPVALTRATWDRHVSIPKGDLSGQSEKGRLWDILWMASFAARQAGSLTRIEFTLSSSANDGKKLKSAIDTTLVLSVEGDDDLKPTMTISLPGED